MSEYAGVRTETLQILRAAVGVAIGTAEFYAGIKPQLTDAQQIPDEQVSTSQEALTELFQEITEELERRGVVIFSIGS